MRGIVFLGTDEVTYTEDLELAEPAPAPGMVTVRMQVAGVCHSDVSVIDGTIPWKPPAVLGHEGAGIVEAVGDGVRRVRPGDHVVVSTLANCGVCSKCQRGRPTECRRSIGIAKQPFLYRGEPASNFAATSSFAELTTVAEVQAVKIPDEIPFTSACLIACGVLTGVGAVLNTADVEPGDTAVVFGVGGVGLNVIQGLRIANAGRIVAVDTEPRKEALARQFGATDFIDARDTDVPGAVRDLFPYHPKMVKGPLGAGGVDWAFDCVGHTALLAQCLAVLDWGGTAVEVGVPGFTDTVEFPAVDIVQVNRTIKGSRYGGSRPQHDIPLYAQWYLDGRLELDALVTRVYPLRDFTRVLDDMGAGDLARGVLEF